MAITTETAELMKKRKTIVTVKNFAGRFVDVNLDKAERMVAQDNATIVSDEALKEMQKSVEALAKAKAKTTKK